jgi:hypothetical protein
MTNIRARYGYVQGEVGGQKSLTVARLGSIKRALGLFDLILFIFSGSAAILAVSYMQWATQYAPLSPSEALTIALLALVAALLSLLGLCFFISLFFSTKVVMETDTVRIGTKRFSKKDIHPPGFQSEALSLKNIPEKFVDWLGSLEIHHVYFYYGCEKRYCVTTLTKPQAEDVCAILNAELPLKPKPVPQSAAVSAVCVAE